MWCNRKIRGTNCTINQQIVSNSRVWAMGGVNQRRGGNGRQSQRVTVTGTCNAATINAQRAQQFNTWVTVTNDNGNNGSTDLNTPSLKHHHSTLRTTAHDNNTDTNRMNSANQHNGNKNNINIPNTYRTHHNCLHTHQSASQWVTGWATTTIINKNNLPNNNQRVVCPPGNSRNGMGWVAIWESTGSGPTNVQRGKGG